MWTLMSIGVADAGFTRASGSGSPAPAAGPSTCCQNVVGSARHDAAILLVVRGSTVPNHCRTKPSSFMWRSRSADPPGTDATDVPSADLGISSRSGRRLRLAEDRADRRSSMSGRGAGSVSICTALPTAWSRASGSSSGSDRSRSIGRRCLPGPEHLGAVGPALGRIDVQGPAMTSASCGLRLSSTG